MMILNKTLQGAVVGRVYWAVNHPHWVPTIGIPFDSPVEARKYAEDAVSVNSPRALIETRMVFELRQGGTLDTVVERNYTEYDTVIRELTED